MSDTPKIFSRSIAGILNKLLEIPHQWEGCETLLYSVNYTCLFQFVPELNIYRINGQGVFSICERSSNLLKDATEIHSTKI